MVAAVQQRLYSECDEEPKGPKLARCIMEKTRIMEDIIETYMQENDILDEEHDKEMSFNERLGKM